MSNHDSDHLWRQWLAQLSSYRISAQNAAGFFIRNGLHISRSRGQGREFVQYNPYSPGDDLRQMDWHLYARTDALFCRTQSPDTILRVHFIIDATASMDYCGESSPCNKFSFAAAIASVLATLASQQSEQLSLTLLGGKSKMADSAILNIDDFCQTLQTAIPCGSETLETLAQNAELWLRQGMIVFIISDFIEQTDALEQLLRKCNAANAECRAIQILDSDELTLPFDSPAIFEESETLRQVNIIPKDARDEYMRQLNNFINSLRNCCERNNSLYALCDTSQNPLHALSRMLTTEYLKGK